jgi:hypothetical protein
MKIYRFDYKKDIIYAHDCQTNKWIVYKKISQCSKKEINVMKNADSNEGLDQQE